MHFDEPRNIPDPGFAGDTGGSDPALAESLRAHRAGEVPSGAVLSLLQDARLLVPVVAVLGEVEYDEAGLAHDKTSDMAAVLIQSPDGRKGLMSFTSIDSMLRWNPEARPVPVPAPTAASAAVQDGAAALLVDLAGPDSFVVSGDDLVRLASGHRLVGVGEGYGWIGPQSP